MNTKPATKPLRIKATVLRYTEDRAKVLALRDDEEFPCLEPEAVGDALDQCVSSRKPFGLLRQAPTFQARPAGSILHRALAWHGGGGNLHGLFAWRWDAGFLRSVLIDPENYSRPWHAELRANTPVSWNVEAVGYADEAFADAIDTTALILRGGASPAADAWKRTGLVS